MSLRVAAGDRNWWTVATGPSGPLLGLYPKELRLDAQKDIYTPCAQQRYLHSLEPPSVPGGINEHTACQADSMVGYYSSKTGKDIGEIVWWIRGLSCKCES